MSETLLIPLYIRGRESQRPDAILKDDLAVAVISDIGGPLSHSSIVAREYGIPAVMIAGNATRRIQNGQMITVDGSAGTVTLKD